MPIYEYQCKENNHSYTEVRSINEDQKQTTCPKCQSNLSRIFEPTPTIFNGSGFYKTDSRK
jgi:putative FmdB family regulatory protein